MAASMLLYVGEGVKKRKQKQEVAGKSRVAVTMVGRFFICADDCPVKRLAGVAPDVDLGECTLHSPPQKWLRGKQSYW